MRAGGADEVGALVLAEAIGWIGTPYRHQASRQGVGCDCLGLIRGVWRGVYGCEASCPASYAPDWAETGGEDVLLAGVRALCPEKPAAAMSPGDLLLFRWRPHLPAKHAGIVLDATRFIHAYQGMAVTISALVPSWRRRIAGVFAFPAPTH